MADTVYTTPLPAKLGIREGSRVALVGAPGGAAARLEPLPSGASLTATVRSSRDVIVVFATRLKDLARRLPACVRALDPAGGLWIAYPKRAGGVATDLTFEGVQSLGLGAGLVDNKSIAWDETWSAVRFVYRVQDRPRAATRRG